MDERKKRVAEPTVESATGAATSSATGDAASNAASDSASNVTCDTIGDSSATAVKVEQRATELTAESATSASAYAIPSLDNAPPAPFDPPEDLPSLIECYPFELKNDKHVAEMREVRDYLLADLTHLIENEEAGPAYAKWAFNKLEKLVPALKLYHEDGLRQIKEVIVANPDAECLKDISRAIDGVIEVVDNQRMTLEKMWQVQTEREQLKADQEQLRAEQKQLRAAQAQLKADQEQMKARESELETKISNAVADAVANIKEVASGEVEFRVYRATRRMM